VQPAALGAFCRNDFAPFWLFRVQTPSSLWQCQVRFLQPPNPPSQSNGSLCHSGAIGTAPDRIGSLIRFPFRWFECANFALLRQRSFIESTLVQKAAIHTIFGVDGIFLSIS
jgi:hypothetical protein